MRRKGHPSRPKAMTCCFFASLKTLLIPTKATALRRNQRPRASFSLAGFQVTLIGRFWVTAEGRSDWLCALVWLLFKLEGSGIVLEDLFVREAFRGRGIGRALLCQVARIARQEGSYGMRWEVLDWDELASKFYRSLGCEFFDEWRQVLLEADARIDSPT